MKKNSYCLLACIFFLGTSLVLSQIKKKPQKTLYAETLTNVYQGSSGSLSQNDTNLNCITETNDIAQPVGPDSGDITTSIINISDDFLINDVNVTLNLDHPFLNDLDVRLIAPDGTQILMLSAINGTNFTNTILDDEANTDIFNGSTPFTGSFRPQTLLSNFDGLMSAGDWTLEVEDFLNENGGTLNSWSIELCPNPANDVGVVSIDSPAASGTFSDAEMISVTLTNFGTSSAGDFDVSFQVNGGTLITERFSGTLASGTSDTYTFTAPADLSAIGDLTIISKTNLNEDEDVSNDSATLVLTSIAANDLGVIAVTAPTSAEGLGDEAITITIENFGGVPQSGFDVSYVLDAGTPVAENFTETVNAGETATYTFTTLADFSSAGDHEVVAKTASVGDSDITNDTFTAVIANLICITETNDTAQPIGPNSGDLTTSIINITDNLVISDVNVTLNIDHLSLNDIDVRLIAPDGTQVLMVSLLDGTSLTNTVLDDEAEEDLLNGSTPYTGSYIPRDSLSNFDGLMSGGDWTLEIEDFINENDGTLNSWSIQLCTNSTKDVGVTSIDSPAVSGSFSDAEMISVTLSNFGANTVENFDVSYQINGGLLITETYSGPLAPFASDTFTFTATADLSVIGDYTIVSKTNLNDDEDISNDSTTLIVSTIISNDLGVVSVTAPSGSETLGNEAISIIIENFGGASQSGFDVSYALDGGNPVVENFTGTVNAGESTIYTFTTLGDFSSLGDHEVVAKTLSIGDADITNDTFTAIITNLNLTCETGINDTVQPVGPNFGDITTSIINFTDDFVISDVNVTLNIDHLSLDDLDVRLIAPDGTNILMLSLLNGTSLTNTVLDDEANTDIFNGSSPFTGLFTPQEPLSSFDGLMSVGDWTLEIQDFADGNGGTLNSWSIQLCTENVLSVNNTASVDTGYTIISQNNNQFLVKLETTQEKLNLNIYNALGQNLSSKTLKNETGNGYEHTLDMSYAQAGIYFVKIGNSNESNIKRIIVR